MKIKLNTGQIVEERLNRAQRLIRLGKASIPEEIPFVEPSKKEVKIIKEYSDKTGWPISDQLEEEKSIEFIEPFKKTKKGKKKKDKVAKSNFEYSNEL